MNAYEVTIGYGKDEECYAVTGSLQEAERYYSEAANTEGAECVTLYKVTRDIISSQSL